MRIYIRNFTKMDSVYIDGVLSLNNSQFDDCLK